MEKTHRIRLVDSARSERETARFMLGTIELPGVDEPDFQALFRHLPGMFIATRPDFTIAAASDDLLRKTFTWREEIIGRNIFDVFPDGPGRAPDGAHKLESSLRDVIQSGTLRVVRLLRYDMQDHLSGDAWIEKFWTTIHHPVLDCRTGRVMYVVSEARDVTRVVNLALWIDDNVDLGAEMGRSVRRMRRDLDDSSVEIARARESIALEMEQTGATPGMLVSELKAFLRAPETRLYLSAGEWVADAGVYVAYHRAGCYAAPRVRYYVAGAMLPSCEHCGNDVLYRFSHSLS
jgi:hypothetical protein